MSLEVFITSVVYFKISEFNNAFYSKYVDNVVCHSYVVYHTVITE